MTDTLTTLCSYLPPTLLRQICTQHIPTDVPHASRFSAVLLFADVSGFTPLTERLAAYGPRGAEELTRLMNSYFARMIALLADAGGEVIKFGGDALFVLFSVANGDSLAAAVQRAEQAATVIQAAMTDLSMLSSLDGPVPLSMKVIITAGEISAFHIGGVAGRWEYIIAGDPLMQIADAEDAAAPGTIVLSHAAQQARTTEPLLAAPLALPPVAEASVQAAASRLQTYIPLEVQAALQGSGHAWLAVLRPMSVLFIKVLGIDDDAAPLVARLHAVLRLAQTSIYEHEGSIVRVAVDDKGTVILALFGAPPHAHEDDALRAVRCALELHERVQTDAATMGLGFAIGITTGQVFVGPVGSDIRREYTAMGDTVNLAARMMVAASKERLGTLCDANTYQQTQAQIIFETLPPARVKGKRALVPFYRPRGAQPAAGPPQLFHRAADGAALLPLVGRQAELALVGAALDDLRAGRGRVLIITGEAGIGKSRLLHELARLARMRGLTGLTGAGRSIEQRAPYRAWRELLQTYFDLPALADAAARQAQVQRVVAEIVPDQQARLPLLNDLLDVSFPETTLTAALDPALRQENLVLLILALLRGWLHERPLIIVLEDAHWLDSLSWELVGEVQRSLVDSGLPLLLVLATRPLDDQAAADLPVPALHPAPDILTLRLSAFLQDETMALARQRLGLADAAADAMPALLADLVHQHTGGNPFFAEALLDLLREQGHLSMATDPAQGRPRCVLHGDITRAIRELPATVRGLVLARLDQLPYDTRITLQVAAVIGQNFAVTILYDVLHAFTMISPAALQRHLADLLARDITQQMPAQEQGYRFRHAIFQEAAYQTLLYAWRHDLHRAVARWYEQHYDDSAHLDALTLTVLAPRALQTPLAPYYPRLVHHYHHAEDQEQERRYAGLAGLWTAARYANAEAVQHLSRALDLTPGSTYDERYALLLAREQVFNRQGRRTEQAHDLAALETLGAHLNDSERRAEVALRHAHYGTVTGDYTAAIIAAQEALDLNLARVRQIAFNHYLPALAPPAMRPTGADERPDLRPALSSAVQVTTTAYLRLSRALWAQGNYAAARQQLEQAQVLAQGAGLQAIQAESLLQLGKIAYYESNYTVARSCGEHALALYQAQEDRQGAAQALTHLANVMNDQAEYALACDYFDKVLAIHREMGDRYHEGVVLSNLAETYREQGDYATAQAMYQTVLDLCRAIKDMQGEGVVLLSLGIAHSEQGKYTQAASYINQAQPIFHALDDQYNLAMVMDSLGLLSQYQGDYPQAAACYQQAHTIRQAIGDQQGSGRMYALLGLVAYYMGALDQAGAACRAAVEIAQAHDYAFEQANALLYLGHVQTAQGALEEAHDTYQQALIILHKNEQTTQVCEAQAGLARLALAQGYLDAAQAHTEAILTHLDTAPDLPGTDEPLRVYLTCYEVLRAAQDARAPALLRAACTLLRERAALIEDARLRQSFLENVAAHRALLRAEQREAAGPVAE